MGSNSIADGGIVPRNTEQIDETTASFHGRRNRLRQTGIMTSFLDLVCQRVPVVSAWLFAKPGYYISQPPAPRPRWPIDRLRRFWLVRGAAYNVGCPPKATVYAPAVNQAPGH